MGRYPRRFRLERATSLYPGRPLCAPDSLPCTPTTPAATPSTARHDLKGVIGPMSFIAAPVHATAEAPQSFAACGLVADSPPYRAPCSSLTAELVPAPMMTDCMLAPRPRGFSETTHSTPSAAVELAAPWPVEAGAELVTSFTPHAAALAQESFHPSMAQCFAAGAAMGWHLPSFGRSELQLLHQSPAFWPVSTQQPLFHNADMVDQAYSANFWPGSSHAAWIQHPSTAQFGNLMLTPTSFYMDEAAACLAQTSEACAVSTLMTLATSAPPSRPRLKRRGFQPIRASLEAHTATMHPDLLRPAGPQALADHGDLASQMGSARLSFQVAAAGNGLMPRSMFATQPFEYCRQQDMAEGPTTTTESRDPADACASTTADQGDMLIGTLSHESDHSTPRTQATAPASPSAPLTWEGRAGRPGAELHPAPAERPSNGRRMASKQAPAQCETCGRVFTRHAHLGR